MRVLSIAQEGHDGNNQGASSLKSSTEENVRIRKKKRSEMRREEPSPGGYLTLEEFTS